MNDEDDSEEKGKRLRIILSGLAIHFLLLLAVFDIYFASPLDHGMSPIRSTSSPPAKRLVLFVADGLRAQSIFGEENENLTPFLTNTLKNVGSWGVAHTRVPTESRPGHVAMLAGIYEDPSAILKDMKIGIIGAGAAGLASLKHSLDEHHECEVFEKTSCVGGTWNYTDKTGVDEFGLPIHTSMYQGLMTNLPKELMQFEDFPFSKPKQSYVSQPEVLQYINDYVSNFNLLRHIKFLKNVIQVTPIAKEKWCVKVKDLKSGIVETKEFDAIFVCIGNYSVPNIPTFKGSENFKGTIIHSHDFRKCDGYKNRKVLVIGAGPSGIDIARLCKGVTDHVILSHKSPFQAYRLPESIKRKPGVQHFNECSVTFCDGSEEAVDDVILCTGYVYSYPFLSEKCDITVENKCVKYLYKQVININHPTMGFIGIPFRIYPFIIFGIQVRFFLAYLKKTFVVSHNEMMEDRNKHIEKLKSSGLNEGQYHFLGTTQGDYMEDLAKTANIKGIPPVFNKLYKYVSNEGKGKKHLSYEIINDENFVIHEN